MPKSAPTFPDTANMADYFLFARLREGRGEHPAILWGQEKYTYARIADLALRMSTLLKASGVRRGERVVLALPDGPMYAVALFGVLAHGAVVAMANPDAPLTQLEYVMRYTRATAIVTIPSVAKGLADSKDLNWDELLNIFVAKDAATGEDPFGSTVADYGQLFAGEAWVATDLGYALRDAAPRENLPALHRDEPSMWLFTSGSTGEPKANVHTHRDYLYSTEVYAKETVGYRVTDVTLSVSRLYFGYATGTNLFFPFAVGATAALFSERPNPTVLAENIERYKPSIVTNVPTMLGKLLDADDALRAEGKPGLDFSSVRFSLSAGEALPEALLRRWQARFASDVYDGIGSAEMFHIYASNRPGDIKPGSLGKVVEGYELRILPEEADGAGAVPCAAGDIGVLWVKGDSVSLGYWLDRDKSFKTFHGHWCRTGDLFHIDAEGYLYFDGRSDDLLKVGGIFVAPREIEEALMQHDAVSLCAVIGVEEGGFTRPKAFVELRAAKNAVGSDLVAEFQEFLRGKIAKYKVPKTYEIVSELPKNDRGKVDKKALRERGAAS